MTLLQDMQKEIEAEGEKEEKAFDKFMCYCTCTFFFLQVEFNLCAGHSVDSSTAFLTIFGNANPRGVSLGYAPPHLEQRVTESRFRMAWAR